MLFTTDHLHVAAADYLCLWTESKGDPFYIEHLGYIVHVINTNESLEYTLEHIN